MPRIQFQSRNRDAFDFKILKMRVCVFGSLLCFNLVIEMLLISSDQNKMLKAENKSFNLVIEMLLISSIASLGTGGWNGGASFQSRNRDAFDFKLKIP